MEYHTKLSEIDEEQIQIDYDDWKTLTSDVRDVKNQIRLLESKIKSLNHHNEDLMKFKYDENCEYCIKNGKEQIYEQEEIQSQLKDLDKEYKGWETQYKIKSYNLQKLDGADERNRDYHIFSDELTQIQHDAVKIGGKIDKNEARFHHIESEIVNIDSKIHQY